MRYSQKLILKNGKEVWLKNGDASDGRAVYENFNATHAETDYLLSLAFNVRKTLDTFNWS